MTDLEQQVLEDTQKRFAGLSSSQLSQKEQDQFADLESRYQGAVSDPNLSYDNPTAYPKVQFAPETPNLSSRYYDRAGNFRYMAPNPQAPANQPQSQSQFMGSLPAIQNLSQLAGIMKQIQGVPDELKTMILSRVTGVPLTAAKAQSLQDALLKMQVTHEEQAPQRAQQQQYQQANLDLRKQQLDDMRTYRQGLVDQGTKFSAMMLRQHISDLTNQLKGMLQGSPEYIATAKELQDSVSDFGSMAKGFQASPQSATRGGAAGSGTIMIGGKPVKYTLTRSAQTQAAQDQAPVQGQ